METQFDLYRNTSAEDEQIISLLFAVYVEGGYTQEARAQSIFTIGEIKKRGTLILAWSLTRELMGMVICAHPNNPYQQVARADEAEMHLLAVHPRFRGQGLGDALCRAFEQAAKARGCTSLVLSTQPEMQVAHRLYERMGYKRNPQRDWSRNEKSYLVYEKSLSEQGGAFFDGVAVKPTRD